MTFAGDMPEGWAAHLMHASFDNLIEGAAEAARQAHTAHTPETEQLALMVSCIGRRLLMGQRISEEVEAACDQLGPQTSSIGFYSYGELCPQEQSGAADLHNQTMTITTISEAA